MISGILTGLMLIVLNTASPAQISPEQLLEGLNLSHDRLAFSETRTSGLLNEPLEITGELRLGENRVLERRTQTPYVETQLLAADHVEVRRPDRRSRRFSLIRAPELVALREVLLAIMSGNTGSLEDSFHMTAAGQLDDWSLELRPRADRVANKLTALVLSGSDQRLDEMEMILTDGDTILTRFYPDS